MKAMKIYNIFYFLLLAKTYSKIRDLEPHTVISFLLGLILFSAVKKREQNFPRGLDSQQVNSNSISQVF